VRPFSSPPRKPTQSQIERETLFIYENNELERNFINPEKENEKDATLSMLFAALKSKE
jgi:hypothetical protein